MKLLRYLLLLMFIGNRLDAQVWGIDSASGLSNYTDPYQFGNDWVDPSQSYYKLLVAKDGIYRVTNSDLQTAGINTSSLLPANLHLMYRGEEQLLYVNDSGGVLSYFEFIGKENDGRLDSLMYRNPGGIYSGTDMTTNIYKSLFSDTSAYFVYWDNQPGLRFTLFSDTLNYNSIVPEPWFRSEAFLGNASLPYQRGSNILHDFQTYENSQYTPGEGYGSLAFQQGGGPTGFVIPIPGRINSGNATELKSRLVTTTGYPGQIRKITINNTEVDRDTLSGLSIKTITTVVNQNFPVEFIFLNYSIENSVPAGFYESRIYWLTFRYDRSFGLSSLNAMKALEWSKATDAFFCFKNVTATASCVMYDNSTGTRIDGTLAADSAKFIVPGSTIQNRELYMATDQGTLSPVVVPFTRLNNYSNPQQGAEFIIVTHRSLDSTATNYKNYRENSPSNPHSSMVVFTDELYDEFGYGSPSPQAMRNFFKYALEHWQVKPKYILLWGHANGYHRYNEPSDLVPTWGVPASDYLLVSDFYPGVKEYAPRVSIGRVSIGNNTHGQSYLNKIIQYESTPHAPWMKETMLVSGGNSPGQQGQLAGFMIEDSLSGAWRYKLQAPPFAAHVNWARKYNGNLLTSDNNSITDIFNKGVSLFHFFGHSSETAYELDILPPAQYSNFGKYPFIIAFGCYGGDFTSSVGSMGESFLAEPGKGSIGYLANASEGQVEYLKLFGNSFYKVLLGSHYGKPIGDVIKETIKQYTLGGADYGKAGHARQMNLQGDPSLILNIPVKPDLSISNPDLFLSPSSYSSQDNQLTLKIITHNTGSVPTDSFRVSVKHFTASGAVIQYPSELFPPIAFLDTLSITFLNTLGPALAGQNIFEVTIDTGNVIDEYLETNNIALLNVIIPGNAPAALFPPEFAIVPSSQVYLAASAYVITTQPNLNYVFEIDTSANYNSPFKINSGPVSGTTVYSNWNVPLTLTDSSVYFWRVKLDNSWPEVWTTSSFRYISGRTGWTQCRPVQFSKDETEKIKMNELTKAWEFLNYNQDLHAWVEYNRIPKYQLQGYSGDLTGGPGGVRFTPIQQRDLVPSIQNTLYGDWSLMVMPEGQSDLINSIQNTAPGDYYLIASNDDPYIQFWNITTKNALELIGVDLNAFSAIPSNTPFIIFGQKGASPGSALLLTNPTAALGSHLVDLNTTLSANYYEGKIKSTLIGPAKKWNELNFKWNSLDNFPSDSVQVSVYGIQTNQSETLLYSDLQEGAHQIDSINATTFPRLRIEAKAKDYQFQTAPQLVEWSVFFEAAPDAAIDPTINYSFNRDTVNEGETVSMSMAIRNLTDIPMDSLLIRFLLQRADRSELVLDSARLAPLVSNGTLNFNYSFNTAQKNLNGVVTFIAQLNPGPEQVEMYSFNNFWFHRFVVEADKVNPLLDVTFNGKHIMEGDIVSSEPEIRVEVNDENAWLPVSVNDTTFEIWFGPGRSPSLWTRISIQGNPQVEVLGNTMPQNKSGVIFTPGRLENGEYTLRVKGKDYTGNTSGNSFYEVHFNVTNEKSISQVLNYPNPFSTSTKFVYTLTGNELPDQFEIRIFTITGKLVKVIDLQSLGEIYFGKNITEYAWDGHDDYGDPLANGVYVYQVFTSFLSREEIKTYDNGIDQFFKNGFGKLYIMR